MDHVVETIGLFLLISGSGANPDSAGTFTVTRAGTFRSMSDCASASKQAWISDSVGMQFKFACIPVSSSIRWSAKTP